jgi:hypothetical protein
VSEFVTDEESSQVTPFDLSYEFHHGPPKTLLAAWCTKAGAGAKATYALLILAERADHPLRTCPDEIPNLTRIGRPSLEAESMIPHDFVMMDTGERLTVRDSRIWKR